MADLGQAIARVPPLIQPVFELFGLALWLEKMKHRNPLYADGHDHRN
jgi:hypothetical protein